MSYHLGGQTSFFRNKENQVDTINYGVLINSTGIVNVDISGNTFKNNKVKLVALLWGAKNNTHSNNTVENSGKIVVQENLELKLMY